MICSNVTINFPLEKKSICKKSIEVLSNKTTNFQNCSAVLVITIEKSSVSACYTAPYVRCTNSTWVPLWNLHVHSKKTHEFKSKKCECFT